MTKDEYDYLQRKLTQKMKDSKKFINSVKRQEGYVEGILMAKSVLHELKPKE